MYKETIVRTNRAMLYQTKCLGWVMGGLGDNKGRSVRGYSSKK